MRWWRFRLELLGPFATPMSSGTLFGHVCWAMVRRDGGDEGLRRLISRLGVEPFLLSDVLPAECLPRPALAPPGFVDAAMARTHKAEKTKAWVARDAFARLRDRVSAKGLSDALVDAPPDLSSRIAHNRIDRHRGTTPETGGLFFLDETWPHNDDRFRDLYLATALPSAELADLLADIGAMGFGRDATTGRGRFRVDGHVDDTGAFTRPGTRHLSLSHGAIDARMRAPRYRLMTHFGKVGAEALAMGGRPWKRPILLMRPGATFAADGAGPLGAWLTGIYQDEERLGFTPGHHAFHLTLPYTELSP